MSNTNTEQTLEQKIKNIKNKIIALKSSDIPLFSRVKPQNVQVINENIVNSNGIIIKPDANVILDETLDDNNNEYKGYSIFKDDEKIGQTIFSSNTNGPTTLSDINISERGEGLGQSVVETIMSVNPNQELEISNIVPRALGFWKSLGTEFYNKDYPDETVFADEINEDDIINGILEFTQDIPLFSRTADQAYFEKEKRKQKISNLEEILILDEDWGKVEGLN